MTHKAVYLFLLSLLCACSEVKSSATADEFGTFSSYDYRTTSPQATELINTGSRLAVYGIVLGAILALASGVEKY